MTLREAPSSLLPHKHTHSAVQHIFLLLLSFDPANRLQAHSYLKIQPGGVFTGRKEGTNEQRMQTITPKKLLRYLAHILQLNVGH